MKSKKFQLLALIAALYSSVVQSGIVENTGAMASFRDLYLSEEDPLQLQKFLFWINDQEFCFLPRQGQIGRVQMQAFYRGFGIELEDTQKLFTQVDRYDGKVYNSSPIDNPRIPYKTHRVWVTGMYDPTELRDTQFGDPVVFDRIFTTNKMLEDSTGTPWSHNLWTLDKSLLPRTVHDFESRGVRVREFQELPSWNQEWQQVMEGYLLEGVAVGKAADTVRWLIQNDEGGVYFDIDVYVQEWSAIAHQYFDLIVTPEYNFEALVNNLK